jgi:ribosome production factor 2
MTVLQTPKCTPGHRPLLHFASDLFSAHPTLEQLRSAFFSLFVTPSAEPVHLAGLEHVISIALGPAPEGVALSAETPATQLPPVHVRVYTLSLKRSGTRVPTVALVPMGPALDMRIRRARAADPELMKLALRRPKLGKKDVAAGLGKRKKNIEVDELGDLRGRVHVARQDLGKLQTRKMKGLKKGFSGDDTDVEMDGQDEAEDVE